MSDATPHTARPAETEPTPADDRYLRCRRFLFREGRPGEDEPDVVPADMCRTPVGVFSVLDCPVWLGRSCRFFEEREDEPEPHTDAEIEDLKNKLRRDYLRWRYRRRTQELRCAPAGDTDLEEEENGDDTEIPARPEAASTPGARKPRYPGDAPSGPPPKPPEEVDLDRLPDLVPGPPEHEGDDEETDEQP